MAEKVELPEVDGHTARAPGDAATGCRVVGCRLDSSGYLLEGKVYREVLKNIEFCIDRGEIVTVIGASGSGKTTLAQALIGISDIIDGSIEHSVADDSALPRISYLSQGAQLLEFRTGTENLLFGIELHDELQSIDLVRAERLLCELRLEADALKFPNEMSGGMRQRIVFGRTIIVRCDILVLDEPFSHVDIESRIRMETLLRNDVREAGTGTFLVTHDLDSAAAVSDHVLVLGGEPSTIVDTWSRRDWWAKDLTPRQVRESDGFAEVVATYYQALSKGV